MTKKLLDDCFLHDADRLTHKEALDILRKRISPVVPAVKVPLGDAAGRILAEQVKAPRNIPAHTNAAVDGYAFAFSDYDPDKGTRLDVAGRAAAGHELSKPAGKGKAVRIFTGAAMPPATDSVVMQEDVETGDQDGAGWVRIPAGLKQGANCRLAGEDVKAGAVMLQPGCTLRPQDIAAAAAAGRGELVCYKPLRVAIYSTGDEVIRAGDPLGEGQVYDANAPMLQALIEAAGVECMDMGVLPDRAEAVSASIQAAAAAYDAVITSGGASRGEEDHVVKTLDALGKLHMWQIAVKPGRPMAFGQIDNSPVFGLPGNPVAVFVCFLLYVRPVLVRLAGGNWPEPNRFPLRAAFSVPEKKTGRREYWRGFLTKSKNGSLAAGKFPRDGSGLISGLCQADGLIEVGEDTTQVNEGQMVDFIPLTEFGIRRV